MLEAVDNLPLNFGFTGKGNTALPAGLPEQIRAGAIGLGLFCWLGAHMRYVWTLKIFYVDPG